MYPNNITNTYLASLYKIVNEINETHPLWWPEFINDTTIIFGLYELKADEVIILYSILKKFKKEKLLVKVIYKREFLIVHFNNTEIIDYLIEPNKWLNLVVYKKISEKYNPSSLLLNPTEDETLRFIYQGTVYHFFTKPHKSYQSNRYHKYIYLYTNLQVKYKNLLDNHLKYLHNKDEFNKKFEVILEKNNY